MSTGKIELSVGAVKIIDKNEMFTEEEISNIDKIPDIEDELEETVKFEIVGEGSTVPPISGGATTSDYDDTEIREMINEVNASLDDMIHNQNFINVKYFGVKGDGSDDTESLKKAFDYINNNSITLYFPRGVYGVKTNFILNTDLDIKILGDNAELILLDVYQTKTIDYLIKIEKANKVKIEGITLNGNFKGDIKTKQNYGLYVNNADNCELYNNTFKNFQGNGVYIDLEVKNFMGKNNHYSNNAIHGLNVTNLYNCNIENEVMESNKGQGFDIVTYKQNYQDTISSGKFKTVSIKNCIIRNNGTGENENDQPYSSGGKLYGCYLAKVENCIFENNGHTSYKGQQLRVCNASIENNIVNGFIVIDNCKFIANNLNQKLIADFGECENLNITNCKFDGVCEYPIQIRSKGLIENNIFNCLTDPNGDNGVKIQSSNVIFRNNIFTDIFSNIAILTQIDSTIPQAISTTNIVIENNTISNAKENYAMLLKNNNSIIKNNKIPHGNRIDLRQGENNIVENNGLVKNNAQNTLFIGYCGNNSDKSYLTWSGTVKVGTNFFNTATNKIEIWNGTSWI